MKVANSEGMQRPVRKWLQEGICSGSNDGMLVHVADDVRRISARKGGKHPE